MSAQLDFDQGRICFSCMAHIFCPKFNVTIKRCHSSCNIGTSLALGPLDQRGWGGGGGLIADREELGPGF